MLITLFVASLTQCISFHPYQGTLQRPFCLANSLSMELKVLWQGRNDKCCVRLATNNVINTSNCVENKGKSLFILIVKTTNFLHTINVPSTATFSFVCTIYLTKVLLFIYAFLQGVNHFSSSAVKFLYNRLFAWQVHVTLSVIRNGCGTKQIPEM